MKNFLNTGFSLTLVIALTAGSVQAQQAGQSEVPDLPDGLSTEMEDRLVKDGIIERQSRIGEDVLILQREGDRIDALEEIIGKIGLEGFRALYPELADQIDSSPLALRSQIETINLIHELEEAIRGPEEDVAVDEEVATATPTQNPRGFIEMEIAPAGTIAGATQMTDEEIARLRVEEREKAREEIEREMAAEQSSPPISLREIYGSGTEVYAVIAVGSERVRVRDGDSLPGDMTVKRIGLDFIEILNGDEVIRMSIRG